MGYNFDTNMTFQNLYDVKFQLDYKINNNEKHNLRFAYDLVQNKYHNKTNTVNKKINNPYPGFIDHFKVNLITLDYTFQIDNNSRLRLGYQNGHAEAIGMPNQKTNLYFTELISRF